MKRIVLSLLLCSVALLSLAQKKLYYCEVKGIEKELTSGLKIVFDFGEKASYNMWGDLSSVYWIFTTIWYLSLYNIVYSFV